MEKDKWFYLGMTLILLAAIMYAYYNFTEKVDECRRDPLKYAVEKLKTMTDTEKVTGSISLWKGGMIVNSWAFGDQMLIDDLEKVTLKK